MVQNPFQRDPAVSVSVGADTSGFGDAIDGAIDKLGNFKGAVAGVGLALGALAAGALVKATQAAADFEEGMVEIEKVTDPETAREMGDAIRKMASEMPIAHQQLSTIAATAGRLGVEGTENIKDFTRVTSEMAVATDLAAEDAADAFARMSTLMNEPIENVRSMGDAINELSNNMAASSSEIVDAATRSSGVLTQLGLTSQEILGLNAAMSEVSSSSRIAGTQLRRFGQEIQDPGKVEDLAAALGMSAEEFRTLRAESPNELIRQMAQQFGEGGEAAEALRATLSTTSRQTLAGLSQNMESLAEAQEMANQQFEEGGSLSEEYEAASSTFNSELQVTKNRLQNVAIEIGENLLPIAARLLEHVNRAITAFSEWNSQTNGMVGTIALVAGALGGFVAAGAATVSMLGGMSAVLGTVGAAFTVLTGPIGLAIAAIALLAGAWTSNVFGIRDKTLAAFNAIRESLAPLIAAFKDEFGETITVLANDVQTILAAMSKWWGEHGDTVMAILRPLGRNVRLIAEQIGDALITLGRVLLALARRDFGDAFDIITGYFDRSLGRASAFGENFIEAIVEGLRSAAPNLVATVEDIMDDVTDFLPSSDAERGPLSNLTDMGASLPETFAKGAERNMGPVEQFGAQLGGAATGSAETVQERTVERRETVRQEVVFRGDGPLTEAMAEQANQQLNRERRADDRLNGRPSGI